MGSRLLVAQRLNHAKSNVSWGPHLILSHFNQTFVRTITGISFHQQRLVEVGFLRTSIQTLLVYVPRDLTSTIHQCALRLELILAKRGSNLEISSSVASRLKIVRTKLYSRVNQPTRSKVHSRPRSARVNSFSNCF